MSQFLDKYTISGKAHYSLHNQFTIAGVQYQVTGITSTGKGSDQADVDLKNESGRKTKKLSDIISRLLAESKPVESINAKH